MNTKLTALTQSTPPTCPASLDFADAHFVTVAQITRQLGYTRQHVLNLIDRGDLYAFDGAKKNAKRSCLRIPIESYREFVVSRLTKPVEARDVERLPDERRSALIKELFRALPAAARGEVVRELNEATGS